MLVYVLCLFIVSCKAEFSDENCEPGFFPICGWNKTCQRYNHNPLYIQPLLNELIVCIPSCPCPLGYIFESDNSTKCVPKKDCPYPPECPRYEVYLSSGAENVCNSYYPPMSFEGCHCKDGYTRYERQCIPETNCNKCPGANEYRNEHGPNIKITCDNWPNYPYHEIVYNVSGCFCQQGYVFDEEINKCVHSEDCTKDPSCPENEVFAQNGSSTDCFEYSQGSNFWRFDPGCYCKEGYVTDVLGDTPRKCIPKSECACPEHQHIDYVKIGKTCDNRNTSRFDNTVPQTRCVCDYEYVLENSNSTTCIAGADCPNPPVCSSVNETVKTSTPDMYCPSNPDGNSIFSSYIDTDCFCKEGYVRSRQSYECILQKDCPEIQCNVNKTYKISSRDRSCYDIQNNISISNNITWLDCFCKEGYVRHQNTVDCVLPEDCLVCGDNQEVSFNGCRDTCESWTYDKCNNKAMGYSCTCKEGYILESNNSTICILITNCSDAVNCGENRIYQESGHDRDCSLLNAVGGNKTDPPGCYCQEGFVKVNENSNTCISEEDCPGCTENQEVTIEETCQSTCNSMYIGRCVKHIEPMSCACKLGYIWESIEESICIPVENCTYICGENQEYKATGYILSCDNYRTNSTPSQQGGPSCYCKEGYVLENGKCTPTSHCIVCGKNEEYLKEGPLVEDTCANWAILRNEFVDRGSSPDPAPTSKEGCFCKEDFLRNSSNICVPKQECPYPPPCGSNQVFDKSGVYQTCENQFVKGPLQIKEQCYCQQGYVRNYKNDCILPCDCPNCKEKDSNSFDSPCVHCYDNCNGSRNCSWNCLGDCDCKPGYLVGSNGTCVPTSSCTI